MSNANRQERRRAARGTGNGVSVGSGRDSALVERTGRPGILWFGNAAWAGTGYGTQAAQVIPRIADEGFKVAHHVNYGFEAGNTNYRLGQHNIPIYGCGFGQWRDDSINAHAQHFKQASQSEEILVITLCDVWTFGKGAIRDSKVWSWTPVDHAPLPPKVGAWFENDNVTALAMSKFGHTMFQGAGINSHYVPHAYDEVFKPTPTLVGVDGSSKSGRELLGIGSDRFVVMMNSANKGVVPNRKAFGENLLAFSMFAKKHSDALLYLHTDQFGSMGGIDLNKLVAAVGIPAEQVKFVDQYAYRSQIAPDILASLYSMADVLLAVSMGEGFGIPVIEAQACGTPVIVSDWTAQPELCGDGWIVESQPYWDALQDSWFCTPLVGGIVDALEQAYARGGGHSQKAVDSMTSYAADVVFQNHWKPLLETL